MSISPSEAHYITESCLFDFRLDGRTQLEYRPYAVTTNRIHGNGISNQKQDNDDNFGDNFDDNVDDSEVSPALVLSNGSSRIHLPGSSTDILCSVKADLVRPSSSRPNEGVVELSIDLSLCGGGSSIGGNSSNNSGGGGGSAGNRRRLRDEESQITSLLQRLVLPHAVNHQDLVVFPGRYVWRLAIDVVVLRCDGCVVDAASMAMREALRGTKLPKVTAVVNSDSLDFGSGRNSGRDNDLVVDGDAKSALSPSGVENCPLVVTVSVLNAPAPPSAVKNGPNNAGKKHRSVAIIDARTEEEACASSRVCVSVDPSGVICGVHKIAGGSGVLGLDQQGREEEGYVSSLASSSMPVAMLNRVVAVAAMASKNLYKLLEREWSKGEEKTRRNDLDSVGVTGNLLRSHFSIQ